MVQDRVTSKFVVLIGSFARGDANERSDCDLLTVDADSEAIKLKIAGIPDSVVTNVVAFTSETFENLYRRGSLFLYHAFEEGRLISGDEYAWKSLRSAFNVQRDYRKEISRIYRVTERFWTLEKFGGKYLWPLVSAFSLLKNASIFTLAHREIYVFNKSRCLSEAIADTALLEKTRILVDFYDYSTKSIAIDLPFDPNDGFCAGETLRAAARAVRGMMNEVAK